METLAATYAENGDFKAAIAWQQKVLEKMPERDKDYLEAQDRLETYKSGKPFRDQPKAVAPAPTGATSTVTTSPTVPPAPIEAGSRVLLKATDTALKVEDKVVADGRTPLVYRVDRVNGPWLWVVAGSVEVGSGVGRRIARSCRQVLFRTTRGRPKGRVGPTPGGGRCGGSRRVRKRRGRLH